MAVVAVAGVLSLTGTTPQQPKPAASADRGPSPIAVAVVDQTHGQWAGIHKAVAAWDRSPYVRMTYADHCTAAAYCVILQAVDTQRETKWTGETENLTTHTVVRFNLANKAIRYPTVAGQTSVACHELGHALGVPHPTAGERRFDPTAVGCITGADRNHTSPTASAGDLDKLARIARGLEVGQGSGAVGRLSVQERQDRFGAQSAQPHE